MYGSVHQSTAVRKGAKKAEGKKGKGQGTSGGKGKGGSVYERGKIGSGRGGARSGGKK